MGISLPGFHLYYLTHDNLAPEEYERILSPTNAWREICNDYEFDDSHSGGLYLVNMRKRQPCSSHTPPPWGEREKARMKSMVHGGEVVMLNRLRSPAGVFSINDEGQLVCHSQRAFGGYGTQRIIRHFQRSVSQRDYTSRGGKPRPTPRVVDSRAYQPEPEQQVVQRGQSLRRREPQQAVVIQAEKRPSCRELFFRISKIILKHEGGYVNDPNDRGGETNMGITIATWQAYDKSDLGIEGTSETLKKITKKQAEVIYYNHYWKPKGFCKLENIKIALMIYDWTITSGKAVKQIRKLLHNQYCSGLPVSNSIDDDMIHCINNIDNQGTLLSQLSDIRKSYYHSLTITDGKTNSQIKYLKGWLNRVNDCLKVDI